MGLQWREPLWLLLGLYPFAQLLLGHYLGQRRLTAYADAHLLPWVRSGHQTGLRRFRPWFVPILAWLLLALALAGPRTAINDEAGRDTRLDVMVVLDLSRSMNASDVQPERRQRALLELREWLSLDDISRVGMVIYAGQPHLLLPFTNDRGVVGFYLGMLEDIRLPSEGSRAVGALNMARSLVTNRIGSVSPAAVLWVTDGDLADEAVDKEAEALAAAHIPLYILGVGSLDGDAIPAADGRWLVQQGEPVRSRVEAATLARLADMTHGAFSLVSADDSDWHTLYVDGMRRLVAPPQDHGAERWSEWYLLPLLPGILLLLWSWRLPAGQLGGVILALTLLTPPNLEATEALQKGISAYQEDDFAASVLAFTQAVYEAGSEEERARALYNLGNSYFQQGDYRAAIQVYGDVLRYRAQHEAAQYNLTLAETVQAQIDRQLEQQRDGNNQLNPAFERRTNALDWDVVVPLTMDMSEGNENRPSLAPPAERFEQTSLTALVNKGLARLTETGAIDLQAWQQRQVSLDAARNALQQPPPSAAAAWNRLFEFEEGYLAPRKEAVTLPGVLPW